MLTHFRSMSISIGGSSALRIHDRLWALECGDDDGLPWKDYESSDWPHDWQENLDWNGKSSNSFMVGLQSYHDNGHEDRRYNILNATLDGYVYANDCETIGYDYHKTIDITLGAYEAIARLESHHENKPTYDRNWAVTICKLIPKCDQFGEIEYTGAYDEDNITVTTYIEKYNGLAKASKTSWTLSTSETQGLASEYTFSKTAGTSSTTSFSVTGEVAFLGCSLTAAADFERTFSSEITIGSMQSESYEISTSSEATEEFTCDPGCHCRFNASALKHWGSEDFIITSKTITEPLNKEDNECTSDGTLTAQRAEEVKFTTYAQCNIQYLVLSSYERAAEKRGSWLGQFELEGDGADLRSHNGRSVYKQSDLHGKERWLYFSSDKYWVVGFTFGSSDDGYLRVADDDKEFYPSTSGWEYKHDGDFHSDDITFTLQYQAEPVTPCSEVKVITPIISKTHFISLR